jgi:hypothetical protein
VRLLLSSLLLSISTLAVAQSPLVNVLDLEGAIRGDDESRPP